MWHKISQQLSWKCSSAFAYEKNCCVNLLFFKLLLAYSLVIKFLGCSILSLCLGKIKKCIFWSSIQVLLILLQVVAILPLLIFPSLSICLSLSFLGRCIIYFQPSFISVAEASKTLRLLTFESGSFTLPEKTSYHYMYVVHKLYHANSGKHLFFFSISFLLAFSIQSNPLTESNRWMQDCNLLWLNRSCLRDLVIVV